jgi:hypothetical protein
MSAPASGCNGQNPSHRDRVGDCVVREVNGWPLVERADPVVLVSADLLQEVSVATVNDDPGRFASLDGDVLTIHGINRKVVYRVDFTAWDEWNDAYRAEWPD